MKKLLVMLLVLVFPVASFAQTFEVSGEVKTGVIWERVQNRLGQHDSDQSNVRLGSLDDAGSGDGRFRLNVEFVSENENIGFSARLNWEHFNNPPTNGPHWPYAFGWVNFWDNQFRLSLGKLGASPWGTGGPEMWRELEVTEQAGMRFEWMPNFVPGDLNVGFVLNMTDDIADAGFDRDVTIVDLLRESVVGASYRNEWFMARAAFRFDSEMDDPFGRDGGDFSRILYKLVYRVEEYVIQRFVPHLSIWALGYMQGMGHEVPEVAFRTDNWMFIQYAPETFTAQIRLGLESHGIDRTVFFVRPTFSYNFLNGLLVPAVSFTYAQDFGEGRRVPGASFTHMIVEPSIRVNVNANTNIAFSYFYRIDNQYGPPNPPERVTQRMNLRAGITF